MFEHGGGAVEGNQELKLSKKKKSLIPVFPEDRSKTKRKENRGDMRF